MRNRLRATGGLALCATAFLLAAALGWPESPVADAAMRGDGEAVRSLLRQGEDVNAAQADGMTALHWAASNGDTELARVLVYAGARVGASTRNGGYTPLHLASRAGNAAVVRALLEAGSDPNVTTGAGGTTALHFAAGQGDSAAVAALLDHGAEIDAREAAFGQTPLMWAAAYGRTAALEMLIGSGADLAATSGVEDIPERDRTEREAAQQRNRRMAALRAAEQPQGEQGESGREEGAAVDSAGGEAGEAASPADSTRAEAGEQTAQADSTRVEAGEQTAQADSARVEEPAVADSTEAAAAPDSAASDSARTEQRERAEPVVTDSAAAGGGEAPDSGNAPVAEEDSASADEPRALSYAELVGKKGGLTPLLFAVREGNIAAVDALLEAGADINQISAGDGTSPLLMAAINGHFDLALTLLERGADPNLASDAGAAPLYATLNVEWAPKSLYPQPTAQKQQQHTYLEVIDALLKAGADPNARLTKHLWYMSYNFDLLDVNTAGATPFWRAAYATDVEAMRLLIASGADPNVPTLNPPGRRRRSDDSPEEGETKEDPSGLPPVPVGGPGVWPIHAATGVGYGEGYAANAHRHVPDGWLPAVRYLVEELGADVNARDHNGYNTLHHAAARGDNELILYLIEKGADITAVSRRGQTTADMANGPVQRVSPFPETVALLEKLGSKNNNDCKSC
jgi:ankyrin repeat protein